MRLSRRTWGTGGDTPRAQALAEAGLVDEFHVYSTNPLIWGGGLHVLGDRGTVRLELDDVTPV
ncbi:MAG: hypothetical protein M3546_11740 [Actinomycetota bacterium]|nr:hypothetical protein [Actinomycetota bacterium]